MSLQHAFKAELTSESPVKEETANVKYAHDPTKGAGKTFGGKQMKKSGG